jgi:hypothetical protein
MKLQQGKCEVWNVTSNCRIRKLHIKITHAHCPCARLAGCCSYQTRMNLARLTVTKVTKTIEDYWRHFTEEYTRPSIENQASFQATFKASPIEYLGMLLPFVEAEGAFHKGVILKKQRRMWSIAFVPFFSSLPRHNYSCSCTITSGKASYGSGKGLVFDNLILHCHVLGQHVMKKLHRNQ